MEKKKTLGPQTSKMGRLNGLNGYKIDFLIFKMGKNVCIF
jgi:hypothetical protein